MRRLPWMIAFGVAFVFAGVFVVQFRQNIATISWTSDFSAPYLMAETITRSGSGGHTELSTYGDYLTMWFLLATAWLPGHRELWELSPLALVLATAAAIALPVRRLASQRAAWLAFAMATALSAWVLWYVLAPARDTTYLATALLGVYLLWLATTTARARKVGIVAAAAGVVLGTAVASDALAAIACVAPFAATAAIAALARVPGWRRIASASAATCLLVIPTAFATSSLMHSAGYYTIPPATHVAPPSTWWPHVKVLWSGLGQLFNGYLAGVAGAACKVVGAAALLALACSGWHALRRLARRSDDDTVSRDLFVLFWCSAAALTCLTFIISTRAADGHESYYTTAVFAAAAVIPLLARGSARMSVVVPLAAAVYMAGSVLGLTRHTLDSTLPPSEPVASQILAIARKYHLHNGYSGYWDAAALTWASHESVFVAPLLQCPNAAGATICPFFLNRVPAWYKTKPGASFLLVDPSKQWVTYLPAYLGTPAAYFTVGTIGMYLYTYDIASRLGPPTD